MATICSETLSGRSVSPPAHLSINTSQRAIVPNKHIPYCSPGPRPKSQQLETPPASPNAASQLSETTSLTYPPSTYDTLQHEPVVYGISATELNAALEHIASQPLPSPKQVFPWLHGLHGENQLQLAFFTARKKTLRKTPKCLRGIAIVKAGGDLSHSRLKGAVAPEEILENCVVTTGGDCGSCGSFLEFDPKQGFSVRNFQIQAGKMATVSDIIVYGDGRTPKSKVMQLAERMSRAQAAWMKKMEMPKGERMFNTFVLTDSWTIVECDYPEMVAIDQSGCLTGKVMDFFHWERIEMCSMAAASEISRNVWLGPTPDLGLAEYLGPEMTDVTRFDLMIEASDAAQIPDTKVFAVVEDLLERRNRTRQTTIPQLEFPGSGAILPPTWSQAEVDSLVGMCSWIYQQANGIAEERKRRDSKLSLIPDMDRDGDSIMTDSAVPGRRVLIHCADGYTESSLLALAYYMYAECVPVHEAYLQLHRNKQRNFFAYASDVALLRAIEPRLLQTSPKHTGEIRSLIPSTPEWLEKVDGSLPSRILPYMYLGNLGHANNPGLLRELGIGQVLSIGEPVSWSTEHLSQWPIDNLMYVDKVQDNGVDPLTEEFGRCLNFIERGRRNKTATLVHCRVGVSRSATICIAEVMNELGLSFPRAYCFVRARRLNVIIQPHLRFSYELLKWEEAQCAKLGKPLRRELEWATISREIAAMNRPYARQG